MVSRDNNYMGLVDGNLVFMPVEENYKESVKMVQRHVSEGNYRP